MKTLKKIFNITLWSLISVFFAVMFAVFMIAEGLMLENETWINNYLGINPYSKYTVDTGGEPEDTRYFKSDYELFVDSEGNVTYDHEAMRAHSMKKALEVATEGSVLLWNNTVNGAPALPLSKGAGISFFGGAQVDYVYHGVGSGYVEIAAKETFKTACEKPEYGLRVNPTLWNAYAATNYKRGARYVAGIDNYIEYTIDEIPYSRISGAVDSSISGYGDAAVMIISRTGGENCDTGYTNTECLDDNYMDLSKTEAAVIEQLVKLRQKGKVQRVILLINSANAMQFKHIKDLGIDACLWVGLGGSASYSQVAALLSGAKSPYGRLADTYVYDNDGAPAAENFGDYTFAEYDGVPAVEKYAFSNKYVVYQEGIYVGYRYYETRYEDAVLTRGNASGSAGAKMKETWVYADEVAYPFGYGKSYTTFEYSDFSAERKRARK